MKKLVFTLILLSVSIISLMAQNSYRKNCDFAIDAGVGIGTAGRSGYSLVIPPLKVDAEYTILIKGAGSLSVGGYFSLGIDRLKSYDTNVTSFLIGPMADFRYAVTDNIDVFGKIIVGYIGISTSDTLLNSFVQGSHAGAGAYVGGTWYLSPKMGIGAEMGFGGPSNLGVHLTLII